MKRTIETALVAWKANSDRKPLIIRGARQVGKTYTIQEFGKSSFQKIITIDFEKKPSLGAFFAGDLNVKDIVKQLEVAVNQPISAPDTLLFFDEVQRCPRAITALRYFKEDWPELAVVAAGSLLEFAFEDISVPVGRVSYLRMYPLSFLEFLKSLGEDFLCDYVSQQMPTKDTDPIHLKLLQLLRLYFMIGGMPEAVARYLKTGSLLAMSETHFELIESFKHDFSKYAQRVSHDYLQNILEKTPQLVGQQIKYVSFDQHAKARDLQRALLLLEKAQIVKRVMATSGHGLPLGAEAKNHIFKLLFLDIGLMQTLCGINWGGVLPNQDLLQVNAGALAEQFVGQEILANLPSHQDSPLYYWKREERGSSAEVDYLITYQGKPAPVEVKSASAGRLKSLHLYQQTYAPDNSFVISSHPHASRDHITWIPLYGVGFLLK